MEAFHYYLFFYFFFFSDSGEPSQLPKRRDGNRYRKRKGDWLGGGSLRRKSQTDFGEDLNSKENGDFRQSWRNSNYRRSPAERSKKLRNETEGITVKGAKDIKSVWQKRKNELISYNDCLYRNIYTSHFVIPLDVDEIIVPRKQDTLSDLFGELRRTSPALLGDFASLSVRNAYFLKHFPSAGDGEDVFFLRHTVRSDYSPKWESGKSFTSTSNALTVFNHYALHVLRPGLRNTPHFLPEDLVQMNHYRETCSLDLLPECAKYLGSSLRIKDDVILKYRDRFRKAYEKSLLQLRGVIPD